MEQHLSFHPWAVIVAAGSGSRMGNATNGIPKQFLPWQEIPLCWHAALAFARSGIVHGIVLVLPSQNFEEFDALLREAAAHIDPGIPWQAIPGGDRRQDSVRLGLAALPGEASHVLVHDGARPFLSPRLIHQICNALAAGAPGAIPGLPLTDTIKHCRGSRVTRTLPREELVAVQTPQGFQRNILQQLHEQNKETAENITDDAALLEAAGYEVQIIEGDRKNKKITNPGDLELLGPRTSIAQAPRIGSGYDVHRYGSGRPLKLGGVPIPGDIEVIAHSDGDVLLHALMDALLGCAGLGDIGEHFPDTDPAYRGISSAVLLDEVLFLVREKGLMLSNVDITIIAQKPRIGVHKEAIRKNVARLLALSPDRVNIKATTEEKLGFTGRGEGIKASAIVCAVPCTV